MWFLMCVETFVGNHTAHNHSIGALDEDTVNDIEPNGGKVCDSIDTIYYAFVCVLMLCFINLFVDVHR